MIQTVYQRATVQVLIQTKHQPSRVFILLNVLFAENCFMIGLHTLCKVYPIVPF